MNVYCIPTISHTNVLGAGETMVNRKDKCSYSVSQLLRVFSFSSESSGVSVLLSCGTWQLQVLFLFVNLLTRGELSRPSVCQWEDHEIVFDFIPSGSLVCWLNLPFHLTG